MGNEESKHKGSNSKSKSTSTTSTMTEDDVAPLDLLDGDGGDFSEGSEYSDCFEDSSMYNIAGYEFVKKLGAGASGVVLQMTKDSVNYAVKICNTQKSTLNFLKPSSHDPKEEAVVMKRLNNANVVKVYDFLDDTDNNLIYIVMELLTGGTVNSCKTLEQKRTAFSQILTALQYLHNQRLAHRDIKVENVMLNGEGVAKLCDFGISVYVPVGQEKIPTEMKGTPAYCPPELFVASEYDPFKADIWAFGVTLFILSFYKLPFEADDLFGMQRAIVEKEPVFPEGADPDLVDLISSMLIKDPSKRITIDGIWAHKWSSGLRPAFSSMFMQFGNVCMQLSDVNTEGIIKKVKRGKLEKVKRKKQKVSKKHKLLHDHNVDWNANKAKKSEIRKK